LGIRRGVRDVYGAHLTEPEERHRARCDESVMHTKASRRALDFVRVRVRGEL
jgi:hypothetical protein